MDLSCIISSGDLELYVLGLLPEEERRQMEQLILLFPELKAEADRISETLEAVAMQSDHAPRAAVKDKLMAAIRDADTASVNTNAGSKVTAPPVEDGASIVPLRSRNNHYLAAASLVALVISLAAVVLLLVQSRNNKAAMLALQQKADSANVRAAALQQEAFAYQQLLQVAADENYAAVTLNNVPGKPATARAKVFWNQRNNEVFVVNESLPEPAPGKQYQLWAIVDGKPVSAGLLGPQKNRLQPMQAFAKADAFAITLEKQGGSAVPTLEEMYVMGKPS